MAKSVRGEILHLEREQVRANNRGTREAGGAAFAETGADGGKNGGGNSPLQDAQGGTTGAQLAFVEAASCPPPGWASTGRGWRGKIHPHNQKPGEGDTRRTAKNTERGQR